MAIATTSSRVYAALALKSKSASTYFAIGKTSPWTNEKIPPASDPNATMLTETIGYKKVDNVSLCRPYVEGEVTTYPIVTYGTLKFVLIPDAEAYNQKAVQVYYEVKIVGDELPVGTYRQVGVFTDLVPKTGVTKPNLLPSEVQSIGILQFIENKEFNNRTVDTTVKERFIISMENTKETI